MADEQQVESYLIRLGRGNNGFFCPESRFHLMGGVKPQASWPAAAPLTSAVKLGLRTGTLQDALRNIPFEAYATQKQLTKLKLDQTAAKIKDDEDFIMDDDADKGGAGDPPAGGGKEEDDDDQTGGGNAPDGEKLTEEQIDGSKKKDLLAYIEKHELSLDDLGLDAKSKEDDIKNALKIHFGYKMV